MQIYAAIDNDGLVEGVDLEGGGTGSTGAFTGVKFAGGTTFELADGAALNAVTIAGATLDATGTVTASGTMTSGTIGGAGTLHVNGPFTWSGGTMSGTGITRVTSTLTHAGNTTLSGTRVLANEGTLNLAGGYINDANTPLVRNTGTIRRTAAADVQIYAPIDNDGRVENVALAGGGSGSTGEFSGVRFIDNVTFDLSEGARLIGTTLAGATLNATGTVTASGTTLLSSGTLGGTGTTVLSGPTTWSGGAMSGAGTTRVTGTLTHTAANTALSAGRVLLVEGTLDSSRAINGSGGAAIRVTGTYKGTGSTTAAVDNDGLVQGIELGGGGKDASTGEFSGATLKAGTFEVGGKLSGDAAITGATVTGTVNVVAAKLAAGTLGAATDVTGTLEWTGGKMVGPGTTKVTGTLLLSGIATLDRVLENRGLIDLRGTATVFGTGSIENLATVRKTAGTSSTIGAKLHNLGTVDGQVGELRIEDGTDQADTGTFTGVVFVGERTLTGAATLPGTVEIADNLTVREGDTLTLAGTAVHRAGTLRGNLNVTGRITWDGGRQAGPGTTTVAASGRIVVTPLAAFGCGTASLADGRTLINHGLLRLEKGADLSAFGGGSITNAGRIELETTNDDACGDSSGINGDARLLNTGTIAKTGGTSPSHLRLVVDNDGTINGPLQLESDETVTHTGTFKDVTVGNGVLVVDTGATLTGTTEVAEGELRVLRPVTVAALKQSGGLIAGPGTLTVTGAFTWSDGDQEGPGATVLAAGATGVVSDTVGLHEDRELRNAGTLTIDDATVFMARGASIRNAGLLVFDGSASVDDSAFRFGYGDAGLVHNTGTLRKTGAGAAIAEATIDNDGVIEVLDGRLELPELLNWSGPMFSGGAGTLAGGTYVVGNAAALLLPGPLKANAARLALGAGSQVLYNELTGTGVNVRDGLGGLLRNAAGGALELTGGRSLTVTGTFVNQGVLALGAGSVLNSGGFTQAAGAVLRPTVTAASAGRVAAAGAVQLGGRLDVIAPVAVGGDVSRAHRRGGRHVRRGHGRVRADLHGGRRDRASRRAGRSRRRPRSLRPSRHRRWSHPRAPRRPSSPRRRSSRRSRRSASRRSRRRRRRSASPDTRGGARRVTTRGRRCRASWMGSGRAARCPAWRRRARSCRRGRRRPGRTRSASRPGTTSPGRGIGRSERAGRTAGPRR